MLELKMVDLSRRKLPVLVLLVLFSASAANAATLEVGPGKPYSSPCQALASARPGDTIEVDASARWVDDFCVLSTNDVTVRSVGAGRARIGASGRLPLAQGKAIWLVAASGVVLEGFEFYGARTAEGDEPGAAIRVESGYGVTLRNCYVHDNQAGLLTGDAPSAEVLVEGTEFANNGVGSGQSHNIEVNLVARFLLRASYSHGVKGGSLVKSRAVENFILYSRLTQETENDGPEIDLSGAGRSVLIGNSIQHDGKAENGAMLLFRSVGQNEDGFGGTLYVVNNTFVSEHAITSFIAIDSRVATPATLKNNIFFGTGAVTTQETAILANNFSGDPDFVDRSNYDYHLQPTSPAINNGTEPGAAGEFSLLPEFQYERSLRADPRPGAGVLDIGAYEYGGSGYGTAFERDYTATAPAASAGKSASTATTVAAAAADSVALLLASGSALAGGTVALDLNMAPTGTLPSGLQWTLNYPAAGFTSVTTLAGPAAVAAGKSIYCAGSAGVLNCLVVGGNSSVIANGIVATISLRLSANPPGSLLALTVTNPISTTLAGDAITTTATGGTVTVQPMVAVAVSPASATLTASQTQQFTATVTGTTNTAVTWSVSPAGAGTVSAAGLYTAPASIISPQQVTVQATSVADPTKSAATGGTVTVQPMVAVAVSPASATLTASQTQQFTATVTGTTNTAVTWSVSPAGAGTVSAAGLYTAPSSISSPQQVTVQATSAAGPTKSAAATVTVIIVTCSYSISPASQSFGYSGGIGSVGVTAGTGCSWTATSNAAWITVTSGPAGTGNGTVGYSAAANPGVSSRTGTMTVAGQIFTVIQGGQSLNRTPTVVAVSPAAGNLAAQTFTFTFADPDGWQDLNVINVLVNFWLDGRQSCYLAYSRPDNTLYLVNNAGDGYAGTMLLNGAGTLGNSQCTIYGAGSSASGSGNTLTLALNMSFPTSYAGTKILYAAAGDTAATNSGWQRMGVWQVPGAPQITTTAVAGINPAWGSGLASTFTFTFTDTRGANDLGVMNILVNDWLDGRRACYLAYARGSNTLYLLNDNGDGLMPGLVLNGTGSLGNSQCTVNGVGSFVSASGNTLVLTLNLTFGPGFAGNRVFYVAARDVNELNNTGWRAMGVWTVQ